MGLTDANSGDKILMYCRLFTPKYYHDDNMKPTSSYMLKFNLN